jgi:hypothetical protein
MWNSGIRFEERINVAQNHFLVFLGTSCQFRPRISALSFNNGVLDLAKSGLQVNIQQPQYQPLCALNMAYHMVLRFDSRLRGISLSF